MKIRKLFSILLAVLLLVNSMPFVFGATGDPCVSTPNCTGAYTSSGYCRVCHKNSSGHLCVHDEFDLRTLSCPECGAEFSSCPHHILDIFTLKCKFCGQWAGDPESCTHPIIGSNDKVCLQCGYCTVLPHSYKNGKCTVCKAVCDHNGAIYGVCTECGSTLKQYEYTVSGDTATITKYRGSGGNITIPSVIDGYKVTAIGEDAFYKCESLRTVVIPDTVTSIGKSAFFYCTILDQVAFEGGITSIGDYAFAATKLKEIKLPDSVTHIGDYAFSYSYDLETVIIPNSVKTIGVGAFIGCSDFEIVHYEGNESEWKNIAIDDENNEELFAAAVHYIVIENQDATCTEGGKKVANCDNGCGLTYEAANIGSALGHSFTTYESDCNATCTADGTKTAACDNGCDETDTVADVGSAIGHSPSDWWLKNDTEHWKHCVNDNCDEETEGSRAAHIFGEWTETKPATATENGEKVRSCECGYEQTEIIPATETPAVPDTPTDGCDHLCHSENAFVQFIWKIFNFFFKLFNIQQHCDCGTLHYDNPIFG